MDGLPDEALLAVFSFLPPLDLLERAPLVCQRWRQLAADSHLWRAHHRALFLNPSTAGARGHRTLPAAGWASAAARWDVTHAGEGTKAMVDYRGLCAPVLRWLAKDGARTPVGERLQWACERGLAGVVYALHFVTQRMPAELCNHPIEAPNPLLAAVVAGHFDVVACFLDVVRGMADKSESYVPPELCDMILHTVAIGQALDLAVWNGHTEVTALLLDLSLEQWGVDTKADAWLLDAAIEVGQWQIARMLISRPTLPIVLLWEHLGKAIASQSELMVGVLLLSGKVSPADASEGLLIAASQGSVELVDLFLHYGVDADAVIGNQRITALCVAKSKPVAERLLSKGADPNLQCPLAVTAGTGRLGVVEALLRAGASVNIFDDQGCTPLSRAAENANVQCVELLLAHGADAALANLNGTTPLSLVRDGLANYDPFEDWWAPDLSLRFEDAESLLTAALDTSTE